LSVRMQPDSGQQYQLRKTTTRLSSVLGAAFAIVLTAQATLYVANQYTRRRAQVLLASLIKLKLGRSTLEEVQPLLAAYKAEKVPVGSSCPSGDIAYGIRVANDTINRLGENHLQLLRAGVRPWGVTAVLSFKGGRLCDFRYSTFALLLGTQYPLRIPSLADAQLIEIGADTTVQAANGGENYEIRPFQALLRGFRESGFHLGLRVVVTPDAIQSEFDHAVSFDLSCFTSFRGCRTLCQMLPLALRDAARKNRDGGTAIPEALQSASESPACSEGRLAGK
jgi:hypothetical protein